MTDNTEKTAEKTFDLTVHKRDPKTGQVIESNPYVLHVKDGQQTYIRNNVKYFPNGDLIPGQEKELLEAKDKQPQKVVHKHVSQSVSAPATEDVASEFAKELAESKKR